MKFSNPLPQPLPKECLKCAKIFKSFVDGGNNGLDGVIPRSVLENARGFAIFTVVKAGFVFSARAGSGVVIAKLEDGSWSAPTAMGTAGLGFGGQAGAEVTEFLIVLNSRAALKSFMAAGSLTLGGNMSVAVGPLGRNGEAIGSLSTSGKVSAMYSYSKTKGLFGGISLEGSVIVERQDANATAYDGDVTAKQLLSGVIEPPEWASPLIKTLESCTGMPGGRKWVHEDNARDASTSYAFGGVESPRNENGPSYLKKKNKSPKSPPTPDGKTTRASSYFSSSPVDAEPEDDFDPFDTRSVEPVPKPATMKGWEAQFESDFTPQAPQAPQAPQPRSTGHKPSFSLPVTLGSRSMGQTTSPVISQPYSSPFSNHLRSTSSPAPAEFPSSLSRTSQQTRKNSGNLIDIDDDNLFSYDQPQRSQDNSRQRIETRPELAAPLQPHEGVARAIALFDFKAVESGDLSFSKGDIITILKRSNSADDWWTGKIGPRIGIFPANFVEVV